MDVDSSGVERTNDDATACKRSAVHFGYWEDPYLVAFMPRFQLGGFNEPRKAPEIHLGYFTRVKAIWNLLTRVADVCANKEKKLQVINLGAGFDTLYWRLKDYLDEKYGLVQEKGDGGRHSPVLKNFVDVDLLEVSAKKCLAIRRSKLLLGRIAGDDESDVRVSRTDLHSSDYHVIASDFTDTAAFETKLISDCGLDFHCPTVFIAECVWVYIDPNRVTQFLQWSSKKFTSLLAAIDHEQINMEDKFGQVMLDNLNHRGCVLTGVAACRNKDSQAENTCKQLKVLQISRFTRIGWNGAISWSMSEIYNSLLPQDEVQRAENIEHLDEKELLQQLFQHYCVTIAWRNAADFNLDDVGWW